MTCESVQRRLLSMSSPQRPSEEMRSHLADCPVCGGIQRRLVEIEQQVAHLPIPPAPTAGMDRVIHRVLTDPTLLASVRGRRPVVSRPWPKLLAAAMVLLALGGTFLAYLRTHKERPGPAMPAADVLLAKVMQRNVDLAKAKDPAQRLAILSEMADDLQTGTPDLARATRHDEDLRVLAGWYDRALRQAVEQARQQARDLETEEARQRAFGPFADRWTVRSQEADRRAAEVPLPSQPALQKMAQTAKESAQQLRLLIAGKA